MGLKLYPHSGVLLIRKIVLGRFHGSVGSGRWLLFEAGWLAAELGLSGWMMVPRDRVRYARFEGGAGGREVDRRRVLGD